jgi:hypothetical protein
MPATGPPCEGSGSLDRDAEEFGADFLVLADHLHAEAFEHHLAVLRGDGDVAEVLIAPAGDQDQQQRLLAGHVGEVAAHPWRDGDHVERLDPGFVFAFVAPADSELSG